MLRGLRLFVGCVVLVSTLTAGVAQAQSPPIPSQPKASAATNARDLIKALMIPHFPPGYTQADVDTFLKRQEDLTNAIANAIAIGVATASVGGASAGFAVLVDEATGTSSPKSDSFGPLFLDRPLTSGRGKLNLSFTFNHTSFSKFQGTDLRNKGLLYFDNRVLFKTTNYEQFILEYGTLEPDVSIFTVQGSYGLTDRVDIGFVMPFANVNVRARRYWDYDVSLHYALSAPVRAEFPNGPKGTGFTQDEGEVSATGIGDMTIRGTVALGAQKGEGAAIVGALRLPTGSEEDLLGTGKTSGLLKFVGSKAVNPRASVYANGGYAFGGLSDEITYGAGVDYVLLSQKNLTVSFEFLGQNLRDSVNEFTSDLLGPQDFTDPITGQLVTYSADRLFFAPGSVNMLRGSFGAKYLLGGGAIVSGGLLFPLNDQGLQASTTAFVGLEIHVGKR